MWPYAYVIQLEGVRMLILEDELEHIETIKY